MPEWAMCISIPVSQQTRAQASWLRALMSHRPRRLFALGWVALVWVSLFLPMTSTTLAVLVASGLVSLVLGGMAAEALSDVQPMSLVRIGFGFWFTLLGGLLLLGGGAALAGLVLMVTGAYPIASEWHWRRRWRSRG